MTALALLVLLTVASALLVAGAGVLVLVLLDRRTARGDWWDGGFRW